MAEEEWRVSDLLDESQPVVEDAKIARQVLETYNLVRKTEVEVRIPQAAIEFAQNTLSDWFEIIAEIEKSRGNIPYLIPRGLYTPNGEGAPSWDQGLELEKWKFWLEDYDFMELFRQSYHLTKMNPIVKSDSPLSGYYNRILPVKFVLRILAALSLIGTHEGRNQDEYYSGDPVTLDELRTQALEHAIYAREYLVSLDRKTGNLKNVGTEIAVGFPENTEKAKERFVAQFVGSKRKRKLSGALIEMGFANLPKFMGFSLDEIHFTPAGWEFMMLPNPIIDGGTKGWIEYIESGKRFSNDEITYLLAHFEKNVPAEWKFMVEVAKSINGGNDRPKQVESELKKTYEWEATKISQMRNGVISRMEELQLLSRHKEGREVTYKLTKLGEDSLL